MIVVHLKNDKKKLNQKLKIEIKNIAVPSSLIRMNGHQFWFEYNEGLWSWEKCVWKAINWNEYDVRMMKNCKIEMNAFLFLSLLWMMKWMCKRCSSQFICVREGVYGARKCTRKRWKYFTCAQFTHIHNSECKVCHETMPTRWISMLIILIAHCPNIHQYVE